jgi:hypothetical protein
LGAPLTQAFVFNQCALTLTRFPGKISEMV